MMTLHDISTTHRQGQKPVSRTRKRRPEELPLVLSQSLAMRMVSLALFVVLAGFLLFAHGCHGNEDHELFTSLFSQNFQPEENHHEL